MNWNVNAAVARMMLVAGLAGLVVARSGVASAQDQLVIPHQNVFPGQTNVCVPVMMFNERFIQGYQLMGTFDGSVLSITDHSLELTAAELMDAELIQVRKLESNFEAAVLFDFIPPIDGRELLPKRWRRAMNFFFEVSPEAVPGTTTEIQLVNDREISRIFNMFTVDAQTVFPELFPGEVRVVSASDGVAFTRGDVDNNGRIEVTDAVVLLNWLFLNGGTPRCLDAADIDDSGSVNLSAAVALLNYLFVNGPEPALPFPHPGLDPTDDDVPCTG